MVNSNLKTFITVAEQGSFSRGAEVLYISKVSVMNQINALEDEIATPLFYRSHRGVTLTPAGKSLYKNGKKLIRLSNRTIEEAREIGGGAVGTIRVGTSMMRPCQTLVELGEKINSGGGNFSFNIVPFNDDEDSLTGFVNGLGDKIDCFVTPWGSHELAAKYNFLALAPCKCAIAMAKTHPLAKKEILRWEDLEKESLLLMKKGDSYILDEIREDILTNHPGIKIVDFDRFYDVSTFNLCSREGYLMETLDIWSHLHPSLVTIPVEWQYKMPYGVVYPKNPRRPLKSFIGALDKILQTSDNV